MKTYSTQKSDRRAAGHGRAAAAFAAAAAALLFSRGRFLALHLDVSRYRNAGGWLPALFVFLAVMLLTTPLLLRAYARKSFSEFLAPGLYHYLQQRKIRRQAHPPARGKGQDGHPDDRRLPGGASQRHGRGHGQVFPRRLPAKPKAGSRLAAAFHISRAKAGRDYREVLEKIDLLINRSDVCPVTYFGIDKIEAFQTPVSAPYRMDLALTYRCNINCSHCYNQRRESAELTTGGMEEDHQAPLGPGRPPCRFHRRRADPARRPGRAGHLCRGPGRHHRAADQRRAPGRCRLSPAA